MKTDKLLQLIQQKKVMRSGGALPLPKAQDGTFPKSAKVNTNENITRSYFDPKNGEIYLNPNDDKDPSVLAHENYHYNQWLQNRLRTPSWYFDPKTNIAKEEDMPVEFTGNIPLQQPSMLTTESWDSKLPYYNRRAADEYIISNQIIKDNPSFNFIPRDFIRNGVIVSDTNPKNPTHKKRILGTDSLMYYKPWTAEGEAQGYQSSYKEAYEDGETLSPQEYDWLLTQGFQKGGSLPKAAQGGEDPIIVYDRRDPRLLSYSKALGLYNNYQNILKNDLKSAKFNQSFNIDDPGVAALKYRWSNNKIKPIRIDWYSSPVLGIGDEFIPVYEKPNQEVIFEEMKPIERDTDLTDIIVPTTEVEETLKQPRARRALNPRFDNAVDKLPNRKKEAVVDALGNPRYVYYNGDNLISEGEFNKLQRQGYRDGGSLPMHQWRNSQVLSQPGPTQAKANFINSSSLGMTTQNAGNILNQIMSNKKNQPFVNFVDTRVNDPVVSGKKLEATRKHHVKGVSREELMKMVNQARKLNTDPSTAITTALWETNMGQTDRNLVHDLYQVSPTEEGLEGFDAQADMAMQAINRQLKLGKKKYPEGPFYKQMQAFQGYGNLYPNTEEDYYGHANQAFFGIPVTRQNPLRTNVLFPYGKTIENFRDSVVIPTLDQYGIKYKKEGGELTSEKAAELLQDGTSNGKPLTDRQKRYFSYIANKK